MTAVDDDSVTLEMPALPGGADSLSLQMASESAASLPSREGLTMWLKADQLMGKSDGDPIDAWPDAAGGASLTQPTTGSQPTFKAAAINGWPAVRFDGAGKYFKTGRTGPGGRNCTFFVVAKGSNYQSILRYQTTEYFVYPWGGGGGQHFINSRDGGTWNVLDTGFVGGEVNIGCGQWTTGTTNGAQTYRNGVLVAQKDTAIGNLPKEPLFVGSIGDGWGEFTNADISEILVYNRTLNATERKSVEQYLSRRYGVSTPAPSSLSWTTVATGLAGGASHTVEGLDTGKRYWFRSLAVNTDGDTAGPAVSATTGHVDPTAPAAPTVLNVFGTRAVIEAPTVPSDVLYLDLQRKLAADPDSSYVTVRSYFSGDGNLDVAGLANSTEYTFRFVAAAVGGRTAGPGTNATTGTQDPPAAPAAPSVTGVTDHSASLLTPALSTGADTLTLQRANATLVEPSTNGLKMWLRAVDLIGLDDGDKVSRWKDVQGNFDAFQTDTTRQPTFTSNGLNGGPAVRFNGDGKFFKTGLAGPGGKGVSLFFVAKGSNYSSLLRFQKLFQSWFVYPFTRGGNSVITIGDDYGESGEISTGLVANEINIGSAVWKSDTVDGLKTYRNGSLVAKRDTQNVNLSNIELNIGTLGDTLDDFTNADVGEILVYDRALSEEERETVERYLALRYKTSVPEPAGLEWTTLATGMDANVSHTDDPLNSGWWYWYRCRAVNAVGSTKGQIVGTRILPAAPDAPAAPTFEEIRTTSLTVVAPGLPDWTRVLKLQQKLAADPDTSYATIATNVTGGDKTPLTGLTAGTTYSYRYLAVGVGGTTPGAAADIELPTADPPSKPGAPLVTLMTPHDVHLKMPALPAGASNFKLQRSPAVIPADPSGKITWLRAGNLSNTLSNGDPVSTWYDNAGSYNATQPTSAAQPIYQATAAKGRDTVHFDGSDDFLSLPAGMQDFTAGMSVFFATRPQSTTLWARFLDFANGPDSDNILLARQEYSSNLYFYSFLGNRALGFPGENSIVNGSYQVLSSVLQGGSPSSVAPARLYKDGTQVGSGTAYVPNVIERTNNYIGKSNWNSDGKFSGDISEIVLFNRALNNSERQQVQQRLAQKYGLPPGQVPAGLTWTTLETGLAGESTYTDSGLPSETAYWYRVVAVGANGETAGPEVGALTLLETSQPDWAVRSHGATSYQGNDVYNQDGANQSVYLRAAEEDTVVYDAELENDGPLTTTFSVKVNPLSSNPSSGLIAHYFDALEGGNEITTAITGAGWTTPELEVGEKVHFRVELTPDGAQEAGAQWGLGLQANAPGGSLLDCARLYLKQTLSPGDFDPKVDFDFPGGPWSYGSYFRGAIPLTHTFQAYDETVTLPAGDLTLRKAGTGLPAVYFNTTTQALDRDNWIYQPGEICFHPGPNGERSVLRWTAPEAGVFAIDAEFKGLNRSPTHTDVQVIHNGAILFNQYVSDFQVIHPYTGSVTVRAGDTLDFVVGFGDNYQYYSDSTGLALTINKTATAAPAAPVIDDVMDGFQTSNPAGGKWTFGELSSGATPNPSTFNRYQEHFVTGNLDVLRPIGADTPCAVRNRGTGIVDSGSLAWQPQQVSLHSGWAGQYSVARWTASEAGEYKLSSIFAGMDWAPTTTDVHVFHNGTSLFDGLVNEYWVMHPFNTTLTVAEGDKIDFIVGVGSNGTYNADTTQLWARLQRIGDAPPSAPGAPAAPTFSDITANSLKVHAPTLPTGATSLTLQQKLAAEPATSFATIATGLAAEAVTDVTGLTAETEYSFRYIAVGTGLTPGPSANATTLEETAAPDAPGAPTFSDITAHTLKVHAPVLPTGATSLTLQKKLGAEAATSFANVATGLTGEAVTDVNGLTAETEYSFRYIAVGAGGSTNGPSANATTLADTPVSEVTANSDTYTTNEDTPLVVTAPGVLANDQEPMGAALTAVKLTDPSHGTVALEEDGSFTYTPAANFNGEDSFTYKAVNAENEEDDTEVTITVTPVNDAPTVEDGTLEVAVDVPADSAVTGNDVDGDTLTFSVVENAAHGVVTMEPDGTYGYVPDEGYIGNDSFTFIANDGTVDSAPGTVAITVAGVNHGPVAQTASYDVEAGTTFEGHLHATDADGDPLTYSLLYPAEAGVVAVQADGTFSYTPYVGITNRSDAFTFRVTDGEFTSDADIYLTVSAPYAPPVAEDDEYDTYANDAVYFELHASIQQWAQLTYTIVTPPAHGTLSGEAPYLTYTPAADYIGTDSLTFKANDGESDSNIATVTFNVTAPGDNTAAGVDALIRPAGTGSFIGDGIYNTNGASQTISATVNPGETKSFEIKLQNEGTEASVLYFTAPEVPEGWTAHYFDAATGGTDITEFVTAGWESPEIAANGEIVVRVELESSATAVSSNEMNFQVGNAENIATDVVRLDASFAPPSRPDLIIQAGNEGIQGLDVYLSESEADGDESQTASQFAGSGVTAVYNLRLENDGSQPDILRLTAPLPETGWTVRFIDPVNELDVTTQVTGDGYLTAELDPGASKQIRMEVIPGETAAFTSSFKQAVSLKSENVPVLKDVVTTQTTRQHVTLDLRLGTPSSAEYQLVGTGVLNNDGTDQSLTLQSTPRIAEGETTTSQSTIVFQARGKVSTVGVPVKFTGPAGDAHWSIKYLSGTTDVTTEVTGAGWVGKSAVLFLPSGEERSEGPSVLLDIEMTPLSTGAAVQKSALLKAVVVEEPTATDTVLAIGERVPSLDASIRLADVDEDLGVEDVNKKFIGEGVYNQDGENQIVSAVQDNGDEASGKFVVKITNNSSSADSFVMKAPATAPAGWTIHYFDALTNGTDITTAITSTNGWTSSTVESGANLKIRLEVAPDGTLTGTPTAAEAYGNVLVATSSVADPTLVDAVKASFGSQRILKLQYTLDQGVTWQDAPTEASGDAIPAPTKSTVGVRAVKLISELDWPSNPEIKPLWDNASYWKVGEAVWIKMGAPSETAQIVEATCGNTVRTRLRAIENYTIRLRPGKIYVPLGGGTEGQTTLTATVLNTSGQAVSGLTVHFTATFANENRAGEINEAGTTDDTATTGVDGKAVVTLHSGETAGKVILVATLELPGGVQVPSRAQVLKFGRLTVSLPEPNDDLD